MAKDRKSSSDIIIKYQVSKYNDVYDFLHKNDLTILEIQTLLALRGVERQQRVPLSTNDGRGKERQFSRVSYQHDPLDFDVMMGLITILDNPSDSYDTLLNKKAFEMNDETRDYLKLQNVSTFYEYMLGGIESCYEDLAKYDIRSEKDTFDALYEYFENSEDLINGMD
ncbi:hypothetical protein LA430_15865 [Lactiplantibacillus plantarum]|uniref:hypothetical protein n=1 Tax=Lactiplantibacillus plantarum TaxID=1590 RepID=UPI0009759465|nr:hypothetical protein [Lactiplantibacillus plantarum]AWI42079.1 hypothetical protein LpLQ80_16380 [Lactiplantibacillus plantarum]AXH06040.1 hypothetical protein CEB41_16350 [Lactiplantibacillus plantarum]MBE1727525.1 hypothetical protein [Lactiplantibacillus plantarum]MCC6117953.1 hypothetical protein [Lactiplantibacillus plantarum]MCW6115500.1 hypothetical protein [Lactiplantibacillus plantarum]